MDVINGTFLRDGKNAKLTPEEFELLHLFLRRHGDTLAKEEILGAVWGHSHFITVRDVDNLVSSLRRKVEPNPNAPIYIHTSELKGYRFERPETNGNSADN